MRNLGFLFTGLMLISSLANAAFDSTALAVWTNEAIVRTYTYSYKTMNQDKKNIAHYFSSAGWIAYSKALYKAKLPESIEKNSYVVSAVATSIPVITPVDATHWKATMNILVAYKNPNYEQHQNLNIILNFSAAPEGQGVRGLVIDSIQSTASSPPYHCTAIPKDEEAVPSDIKY